MSEEENNIQLFESNYNLNVSCSDCSNENKFPENGCFNKCNLKYFNYDFDNNFNLKNFK